MVVVERARVLCDGVEFPTEGAEGSAVDGVRVCRAHNVGSRFVNRMVDHICRSVEESDFSTVNDLAGVIDQDEIRGLDQAERDAKGIDPERSRVDWILGCVSNGTLQSERSDAYSQCDVSGHTLVKAIFAKDSERSGKPTLQVCTLFVRIIERRWARESKGLQLASPFSNTRLKWRSGVWLLVVASLGFNRRGGSHDAEGDCSLNVKLTDWS